MISGAHWRLFGGCYQGQMLWMGLGSWVVFPYLHEYAVGHTGVRTGADVYIMSAVMPLFGCPLNSGFFCHVALYFRGFSSGLKWAFSGFLINGQLHLGFIITHVWINNIRMTLSVWAPQAFTSIKAVVFRRWYNGACKTHCGSELKYSKCGCYVYVCQELHTFTAFNITFILSKQIT